MAKKLKNREVAHYLNEVAASLPNLPKLAKMGDQLQPVVAYTRKPTIEVIKTMSDSEIEDLSNRLGKDVRKLDNLLVPVSYEMINHTKRLKKAFQESGEMGVINYINWVHRVFPIYNKALDNHQPVHNKVS